MEMDGYERSKSPWPTSFTGAGNALVHLKLIPLSEIQNFPQLKLRHGKESPQ